MSSEYDEPTTGVEVFIFLWGCTRLGALGDDSKGQTACERGGTEPVLMLRDVFMQLPSRLVSYYDAFCTASNEKPSL